MQKQKIAIVAVVIVVVAVVAYLALSKTDTTPNPAMKQDAADTMMMDDSEAMVADEEDTNSTAEADELADFILEQVLEDDALTAEVEGDADLILESENDLNAFSDTSYDEGL